MLLRTLKEYLQFTQDFGLAIFETIDSIDKLYLILILIYEGHIL